MPLPVRVAVFFLQCRYKVPLRQKNIKRKNMETYEFIQTTLNELAKASKKGSVTSSRVANIIRTVLERTEGLIQGLSLEMAKKADIVNGKVPNSQLPEGLDDYQEYPSRASFPNTGQSGILYLALDTGKTWRWTGTTYGVVSETLALGETSETAYPGNKGKKNAEDIDQLGGYISTLQNNMAEKAEKTHTHSIGDISSLLYVLGQKSGINHTHRIANLSDYEGFLATVKSMGITTIGRDSEDETGVTFCIVRPDGTQEQAFTIVIASGESAGLMSPAMVEKLLEVDNKADSNHTHTQSDVEGLITTLSSLETKTSTNKSSTEKNALDIEQLRIQLQGKVVSKTFATMTDAEGWMRDPISRRQLLPGSNIWIENEEEDDLWVSEVLDEPDMSGSNPTQYYYKVKPYRAEVPSLEGYAKKDDENTFTENNTFTKDVSIEGVLEQHDVSHFYAGSTWNDMSDTSGVSVEIDAHGVSAGIGSRYVSISGRITRNGAGCYKITRSPFSGSITESESNLGCEELIFSQTGENDIVITKQDFAAFLALKQQLQNVKAPLDVSELLTNYSQDITFEDLQKAQKLFCRIGGVYHEVRIAALREGDPVSDGALYYEDLTADGLVKYLYSIAKTSDGPVETSEPEIISQGGSDVDFVETSEDVYREDV